MGLGVNGLGEIYFVEHHYDLSTDTLIRAKDNYDYIGNLKGYLGDFDGTNLSIYTDVNATTLEDISLSEVLHKRIGSGNLYITVTKNQQGAITNVRIEPLDKNIIRTFRDVGRDADKVLMRCRLHLANLTAIYSTIVK